MDTLTSLPLDKCPALVLNADYRPLSYAPLSLWNWQDSVRAVFRDTVTILAEYERTVSSPSLTMKLPSVLVLKDYVATASTPAFTRFNVFLRDGWTCQYCSGHFRTQDLTFDHVVPRSRGGITAWTNIVTACRCCNIKKGNKLCSDAKMYPLNAPRVPSIYDLQLGGRAYPPHFLHESWVDFIYWDTELDS